MDMINWEVIITIIIIIFDQNNMGESSTYPIRAAIGGGSRRGAHVGVDGRAARLEGACRAEVVDLDERWRVHNLRERCAGGVLGGPQPRGSSFGQLVAAAAPAIRTPQN